jgi:hypothetical protein
MVGPEGDWRFLDVSIGTHNLSFNSRSIGGKKDAELARTGLKLEKEPEDADSAIHWCR